MHADDFWARARDAVPRLPAHPPEAWAFGATPEHADELLGLVLSGRKTGTATSAWDCEASGEPVPAVGDLSIILDGSGAPRAVIETTSIEIVPFTDVDSAHAYAEGEGDRSLESWREIHERFWRDHSERGFSIDMPVVCERFALIYPQAD